jgi:hypothetical protein
MRLPRFTIAGLMGLVVVVAVGVAALRFASELWAGVLLMLTLGVLGAAVLAFHERTGASRSWWRGFALFGWGYLVLAMGPWAAEAIAPHLPTTMGLDALYARMHPAGDVEPQREFYDLRLREARALLRELSRSSSITATPPGGTVAFTAPTTPPAESFRRVGHCLWALLVACVGGVVERACHTSGERTGSVPALGPGVEPGP